MMKISYYIAFSQVKSNSDDFGWGVVLNFQKKANQKVNKKLCKYVKKKLSLGLAVTYERWLLTRGDRTWKVNCIMQLVVRELNS